MAFEDVPNGLKDILPKNDIQTCPVPGSFGRFELHPAPFAVLNNHFERKLLYDMTTSDGPARGTMQAQNGSPQRLRCSRVS